MANQKVLSLLYKSRVTNLRSTHGLSNKQTLQLFFCFFLVLSFLAAFFSNTVYAAQATLSWDRHADPNVAGYKLYYGNGSRDYDWWIDVGNATSFTVTNLSDGVTYFFAATAYDNSEPVLESDFSDEVSKSTCSYSISPTSADFSASGGTGSVYVTTQPACSWTASSGASWLTITSGGSRTGSGTVNYTVGANTVSGSRTTVSTIAGQVFTVSQAGAAANTITASAGTGGSISPSGSISVSNGGNQSFTITPNTGYTIANVLVDGSSVGAVSSYTFNNVTTSHTISASFAVRTYTVTASAGSGGSISPSGSVTVNHGANQGFTITPNAGYVIANVLVDGSSVGAVSSYTFNNVTTSHTISASFAVRTYTVTASAGAGGSISPTGSISVNHGANQSFTITPNTGYTIATVTVDGVNQGSIGSYTFSNITANHTISAAFSADSHTINASTGPGGTISPSGSVTVSNGGNQSFTITPANGYTIANVLVDGVPQGPVSSYVFNNVTTNHTISASFIQVATYTIQTSAGTGGIISPSGTVSVAQGANQTFSITANSGYVVSHVLVDGSSVGAVSSYTFTNVTSNHVITASFVQGYSLTVTKTGTGTGEVTINPTGTIFPPGSKVILKAIKHDSSLFEGFSGDCTSNKTSCTLTMNKNASVTATFKLKSLRIRTTVVGDGTVTLEEPLSNEGDKKGFNNEKNTVQEKKVVKVKKTKHNTEIDYGDQLVYTITPDPGNYIKKVSVDRKSQGSVESITFTDIKRNHNVVVKFAVEDTSSPKKDSAFANNRVFLRDKAEQEELRTLSDMPDEDDDDFIEASSSNQYASIVR